MKARINLNQALVDGLKPRGGEYILWDRSLRGYGVRVRPTGTATDVVQARQGGRTRRRSLGRTGETTEAEARALARRWFLDRRERGTPPAVRSVAFPVFAEEFLSRYRRNWKPGTYAVSLAILRREILPFFAERTVGDIARTDVARWFAGMADRPGLANRALPVLSVMMREAELYGYRAADDGNPCEGVRRYRRPRRERHLDARELAVLGRYLARRAADRPVPVAAVETLLYTGCRAGEVLGLKWEYVRDGKIHLPDSKTGPKTVQASPQVLAILDRLSNNGPHVFPDRAGRGPMTRASLHAFWRPLRERCGFPDVRLHDLRHTFASIAVQNGIPLATVGRLLGHRLGETTLKYVHLSDDGPRAAAAVVSSGIAAILRKGTGR